MKVIGVTNTISLKRGTVFVQENNRQWKNACSGGRIYQLHTILFEL